MNTVIMSKEQYPTTILSGIYRITGEKETVQKEKAKVPDVSNTVALIISSATKHFPDLENAAENKFIAFQEDCQQIIMREFKNIRGLTNFEA